MFKDEKFLKIQAQTNFLVVTLLKFSTNKHGYLNYVHAKVLTKNLKNPYEPN